MFFSVVVTNRNGRHFLKHCLASIFRSFYPNYEVILIDDASTDGSVHYIQSLFGHEPKLKIISNKENLGFSASNNIGLYHAKGDVVIFLNNDTKVAPDWMWEISKVLKKNPNIGGGQCLIRNIRLPHDIQVGQVYLTLAGLSYKKPNLKSEVLETGIAIGASLFARRQLLNRIGAFDASFFIYWEDTDLSWRVWLHGYRVVLATRSVVYHYGGGWSRSGPPFSLRDRAVRQAMGRKNKVRMLIKNLSVKYLIPMMLITFVTQNILGIRTRKAEIVLGFLLGLWWNITNFKDTLSERIRIQRYVRKVDDRYIRDKLFSSRIWEGGIV